MSARGDGHTARPPHPMVLMCKVCYLYRAVLTANVGDEIQRYIPVRFISRIDKRELRPTGW
jgi:hypothetical protein